MASYAFPSSILASGAEAALPLVVGGNPIPAKKAEAIGLLDALL